MKYAIHKAPNSGYESYLLDYGVNLIIIYLLLKSHTQSPTRNYHIKVLFKTSITRNTPGHSYPPLITHTGTHLYTTITTDHIFNVAAVFETISAPQLSEAKDTKQVTSCHTIIFISTSTERFRTYGVERGPYSATTCLLCMYRISAVDIWYSSLGTIWWYGFCRFYLVKGREYMTQRKLYFLKIYILKF